MTTTATGAQALSLLEVLKDEAIVAFSGPLQTFFGNLQKNPSAMGAMAAWVQLQGDVVGALPSAESSVIAQVNAVVLTKISALVTKAQQELGITTAPTAAPPASGAGVSA